MRHLARHRPELVPRYEVIYRENRMSGAPHADYVKPLTRRLHEHNRQIRLPWLVPHHIYRGHLHVYDEVNVLLHHMVELYEAQGSRARPLRQALQRYLGWIEERKAAYNRHRSWRFEELDAELRDVCADDRLENLLLNPRTAAFVRRVVDERRVFNYCTLELEDPR